MHDMSIKNNVPSLTLVQLSPVELKCTQSNVTIWTFGPITQLICMIWAPKTIGHTFTLWRNYVPSSTLAQLSLVELQCTQASVTDTHTHLCFAHQPRTSLYFPLFKSTYPNLNNRIFYRKQPRTWKFFRNDNRGLGILCSSPRLQ